MQPPAYRFVVVDDRDTIRRIADIPPGGTAGYAQNLVGLVVVVGDLSAYAHSRDRHLIYVDSSLASMGFLMAMQAQGLSTCCINWPDSAAADSRIAQILGLERYERTVMLIAYGRALPDAWFPARESGTWIRSDNSSAAPKEIRDEYTTQEHSDHGWQLHQPGRVPDALRRSRADSVEMGGAQPVIAMQTGTERAKRWVGLDSLLEFPRFRISVWGGNPDRLRGLRHRLPFVVGSEIDAVFDVSGFVFSDEWEHLDLRRRADDLIRWSERGVPVVLLPQAFGPFRNVTAPVSDLLDTCELVYARDPDSATFLKGIARSADAYEKISVATDFTTILTPEEPHGTAHLRGMVPIVANWNIAKRAAVHGGSKDAYLRNLEEVVRVVRAHGHEVYGLCHEGGVVTPNCSAHSPTGAAACRCRGTRRQAVEVASGGRHRSSCPAASTRW